MRDVQLYGVAVYDFMHYENNGEKPTMRYLDSITWIISLIYWSCLFLLGLELFAIRSCLFKSIYVSNASVATEYIIIIINTY